MNKLKYVNPKKGSQIILFDGISESLNIVKRHKNFKISKDILIHKFLMDLKDFNSFKISLENSIQQLKQFIKTKKYKFIILDKWYLTSLFKLNEYFLLDKVFKNHEDLVEFLKEFEKRMYSEFNFIKYITTLDNKLSKREYLHNSLDIDDDEDIIEDREIVLAQLLTNGFNSKELPNEDLDYVCEYISLNSKNEYFKNYINSFNKNTYSDTLNSAILNPKEISKTIAFLTKNSTKTNYKGRNRE
ncbi:hypothetical protein [Lacinutrix cladophorae]